MTKQHRNSEVPIHLQVECDIDDEMYIMKKRIEAHYDVSWEDARDMVNESIARLCADEWIKKGMYGLGDKKDVTSTLFKEENNG